MSNREGPAIPAPSMCEPVGEFDVVSKETWTAARQELVAEEKAQVKVRDQLIARRRRLPVTEVDRGYRFVGPDGETDLLGLFHGRRQLIVYRFFYAPDVENWPDGACSGGSMFADTVVHPAHVAARHHAGVCHRGANGPHCTASGAHGLGAHTVLLTTR